MRIKDAMREIRETNAEKGWVSEVTEEMPFMFSEKMLLIISEIIEALEEWRNGRGVNEIYFNEVGNNDKPEGVPIEIADAVIRIFDFCEANKIDLENVLRMKMRYNKTRAFRHGGKRV